MRVEFVTQHGTHYMSLTANTTQKNHKVNTLKTMKTKGEDGMEEPSIVDTEHGTNLITTKLD
jgi:hypothetical protein